MRGTYELMRFIAENDLQDTIKYYFTDDGEVFFSITQNDWFFFASSYEVSVDVRDLPLLKRCIDDIDNAKRGYGWIYGASLFCCIKENLPPLDAYLTKGKYMLPKEVVKVFKNVKYKKKISPKATQ